MAAWPSLLTTTGVTAATPGVAATAAASRAVSARASGSVAAMITGASNPGPNPCAIVA